MFCDPMPHIKRSAFYAFLALFMAFALACSTTPSEPTPDIALTVEAEVHSAISAMPPPTPMPTYTPYPTVTPRPTPTPTPYPTPTPIPTATSQPTPTPTPTATPPPTPTPTVVPPTWEHTESWRRNDDFEVGLRTGMAAIMPQGTKLDVAVATLDAITYSQDRDISVSFACIDDFAAIYVTPYSYDVPSDLAAYSFGVWDEVNVEWTDDLRYYHGPVITDDGASLYITNAVEQREIVSLLNIAGSLPEGHVLAVAMWSPDPSGPPILASDLDPKGMSDAFGYVGCF